MRKTKIKAALCHSFGESLTIQDIMIDPPGKGEIMVDIKACAICHSDIHFIEGAWGGTLPLVAGHEAAGIVSSVSEDVVGFAPGDHVIVTLIRSCGSCHYCSGGKPVHCETDFTKPDGGPLWTNDGGPVTQAMQSGAFAEKVVVHASQAVRIPKEMPLASASLLACGVITGFGAVTKNAQLKAGETVIVIGCGGVGLNAIQACNLSAASTIIALDLNPSKRETAIAFGATHALDPAAPNLLEHVQALTNNRGADHVLVTVGAKAAIQSALPLLAAAGTLTVVGMPASGVLADYEPANLAYLGQRIQGSVMGGAQIARDIPALIKLYQSGRLKLDELVSNSYPLDQINNAMDEVKRGEVLRNVITFG